MGGFALAFRQEGRKEGRGQPEASTKAGSTNRITHPGLVMTIIQQIQIECKTYF